MKLKLWTYLIFPALPILIAGCGNTPGRDIKGPTALGGVNSQTAASPSPAPSPNPSPFASPAPVPVSSPIPIPSPSPDAPVAASVQQNTPTNAPTNSIAGSDQTISAPATAVPSQPAKKVIVTLQMDPSAPTGVSIMPPPTTVPQNTTAVPQNVTATVTPPQTSAAPQSILIVGDSLTCGPFGVALLAKVQSSGQDVDLFCAISSQPTSWVEGVNPKGQICQTSSASNPKLAPCSGSGQMPKFEEILAAKTYGKVIVALGTNSLLMPAVDKNYGEMAQEIAAANVKTCAWIGPPHLQPENAKNGMTTANLTAMESNLPAFYVSLTNAVGQECTVIDSRPATAVGTLGNATVDGVHRGTTAGTFWANSLFSK